MRTRRRRIKKLIRILLLVVLAIGAVSIAWLAACSPQEKDREKDANASLSYTVDYTPFSDLTVSQTTPTDIGSSDSSSAPQTDTQTEISTLTTDKGSTDSEKPPVSTEQYQISTIIPPPANDGTTKKIAFTFDDGPHWSNTRAIAEEFKKYGGKCTYFVVGNRVHGTQATEMAYVASLGNEIGIHAYTHNYYFNKCSNDIYQSEVFQTHQVITTTAGIAPVLLRPPGGSMSKDRIANSDYSIILWNVDTQDWKYKKESQGNINIIVNNVLSSVTDGDIILMHDLYSNTVEAVKILLPLLKEAGYEFVTVSELLGEYRAPGIRYYNAY